MRVAVLTPRTRAIPPTSSGRFVADAVEYVRRRGVDVDGPEQFRGAVGTMTA
jgi:hypothetical protein